MSPFRFERILLDLRYAVRQVRKSPAFFGVTVLTLALGIGATTAIFSIVNSVLIRLPFADPDRLVRFTAFDVDHQTPLEVSYLEIGEWRRDNRTFDDIAGIGSTNWSYILEGDEPVSIRSVVVSGNFFDVVGSRPLLGRTLIPTDDVAAAGRVVVLSHTLWRARFSSDPAIVGRAIRLSGLTFTIVGVMPPAFRYPAGADLWTPIAPELAEIGRRQQQDLLGMREFGILHGIGRLKRDMAPAAGQTDLSGLIRRETLKNERVQLTPLVDEYFGRVRWALLVALVSAFLLMAIACSNIAGLLLARVARRRQEWAVRRAIGGTTADIVRLSMAETALIALAASVAGVAAAPTLAGLITSLDPTALLAGYPIRIDLRVLIITVGVGIATLVIASAGPTIQAVRVSATDSTISGWLRHRPSIARARRWLVVAQLAVAVLLLSGTGLMVRSVHRLSELDLGFDPAHVLVVSGAEPADVSRERHDAVLDEIMAGIRAWPGVQSVGGVYRAPFQGPIGLDGQILAEGDPLSRESLNLHPPVNAESATPDYFSTMGIRLVAGRAFTPADRFDAPGVVIVSQSLARHLWPGQNAVGRRMLSLFRLKPTRSADGQVQWDTVVGAAADVRYREIERPRFDVYLPVAQADAPVHDIVVRTYADALSIAPSVRALIRGILPANAPDIRTMTSMVADVTAVWRMTLVILGAFAAFAVVLSATGLYGLMAYLVEERTREIGIRIALGAAAWQVQRLIVVRTSRLVCVGLAVGLLAAVAGSRVMGTLVFGVSPTDPVALTAAALLIASISVAATYIPMRRAARIDPVVALRTE